MAMRDQRSAVRRPQAEAPALVGGGLNEAEEGRKVYFSRGAGPQRLRGGDRRANRERPIGGTPWPLYVCIRWCEKDLSAYRALGLRDRQARSLGVPVSGASGGASGS